MRWHHNWYSCIKKKQYSTTVFNHSFVHQSVSCSLRINDQDWYSNEFSIRNLGIRRGKSQNCIQFGGEMDVLWQVCSRICKRPLLCTPPFCMQFWHLLRCALCLKQCFYSASIWMTLILGPGISIRSHIWHSMNTFPILIKTMKIEFLLKYWCQVPTYGYLDDCKANLHLLTT